MLLENLKKKTLPKNIISNLAKEKKDYFLYKLDKIKHFPSSIRVWNNSIYCFNKNNLDLIPSTSINAKFLIKDFFNFYQALLEKKIRSKRLLLRLRRLSLNRIFVSDAQFKHNNNKVLINLYLFNKQKLNYLYKLKKIYLSKINKKAFKLLFLKSLKNVQEKGFFHLRQINKNNYLLNKALLILEKNPSYIKKDFKSLNDYSSNFYKNLLKIFMKKYRLLFLYKQLIYLNKSKINYTYLRILKKYLEIMYNKNVEFNLINLKRFYLNSDILSEALKLRITRKRNRLNKIFKKVKDKIKVQKKAFFSGFSSFNERQIKENFTLNNLKYRHVTGFRLQATGRLTKRYTASRSRSKLIFAGNLLNVDSSKRDLSSVLLKGNLKSNIQFTKLHSKTRIGSFGLKGWISGN